MKISTGLLAVPFILLTFGCALTELGPTCNKSKQRNIDASDFTPQLDGTSWCWASTAQNVMRVQNKKAGRDVQPLRQCDVVAKALGATEEDCCGNTATECWGTREYPELAFDKFQFSYQPARDVNKVLDWKDATDELCKNGPFISIVDLATGDRHAVVVTGYNVLHGVRIYDPAIDDVIYESIADFFWGESPDYTRVRDTYQIKPIKE